MAEDPELLVRPSARRILSALLVGQRTLTQLSESTGLAKPSLLPALKRLAEAGWLERQEIRGPTGREVAYALRSGSLHVEVRAEEGVAVSWATSGPVDDRFPLTAQITDAAVRAEVLVVLRALEKALRKSFAARDVAVVLFGSAARDQVTWKSDIDLLFVVRDHVDAGPLMEAIADAVAEVQELVTHTVRAHFTTERQLAEPTRRIDAEAAREGMVLLAERGDPLWQRMARHRSISI